MTRQTILVVDDEPDFVTGFRRVLARDDVELHSVLSGDDAIRWIAQQGRPDLVFMDLRMPGQDGLTTLKRLREMDDRLLIILMTAHTTTGTVIEAMKCGAYDFIGKPFSASKLREVVHDALKVASDMKSVVSYQPSLAEDQASETIIGVSDAMRDVYKSIGQVAASNATVLVTGESGTGKELVAKAIYHHSERAGKPFIAVNCAAIPESLLESELFGHEKGSFSGAVARKPGKFEVARGGTLFLDEIGDMSLSTQTKILRVMQDGTFQRVGGTETLHSDVRVLAATNKSLETMIRTGEFRADLYYRLNVVHIELPPLRERREDIPALIEYFLRRIRREIGRKVPTISEAAMERLQAYAWPGNVRELENVIRNLVLTAKTDTILASDLRLREEQQDVTPQPLPPGYYLQQQPPPGNSLGNDYLKSDSGYIRLDSAYLPIFPQPAAAPAAPPAPENSLLSADTAPDGDEAVTGDGGLYRDVEEALRPLFDRIVEARDRGGDLSAFDVVERALILHALNKVRGNQVQASKLLGITRSTLRKRIARYGLMIDTKVRG